MKPHEVIMRPVITEKSMAEMAAGKYTFAVAPNADKPTIKRAVEELFDVRVRRVNTLRVRGKWRRVGVHRGRRPDWKKAVVWLQEGQKIEFFEGLR